MLKGKSSGVGAYELLLDAIESGALPPGSRLRETELAARFGISRTPVREALKRLEVQGLVNHEPHHGAIVAQLGYGVITELYAFREVMEGFAARLAAIHATPTETAVLQEMIQHDRSLIDNPNELARRNKLFHHQIHQSARNRFLSAVLDNLRTSLVLLSGTTLATPHRAGCSLDEHQTIVTAVAQRDPDGAEQAARLHILNAFKARLELLVHSASET